MGRRKPSWSVDKSLPLDVIRRQSKDCTACNLFRRGTQTVFGEGSENATLMLVGEQPGHEEDLAGAPFVGPAGKLLDKALKEAEIDRASVYMTNAVKHFKWEPSLRPGKPRLHKKPNTSEITACFPWLEAEVAKIRPRIIIAMGRTAAQTCLGRPVSISKERQEVLVNSENGWKVTVTWHPSAILRAVTKDDRARLFKELVMDLMFAGKEAR